MDLCVRTIRPGFVAEIQGIDLAHSIAPGTMAALWKASDAHAVLLFRGQSLTDDEQIAFTRNFGQPERYVFSYGAKAKLRLGNPEMADISNLDPATGKPQTGSARHRMVNLGNRLWHTDSSFAPRRVLVALRPRCATNRPTWSGRNRIRRHLCSLRGAQPATAGYVGRIASRTQPNAFASGAWVHQLHSGRACSTARGGAAVGQYAPTHWPKIDLRRIPCLTHSRPGCSRRPAFVDGADRARYSHWHLSARMACW